jgi:hypothetical protein
MLYRLRGIGVKDGAALLALRSLEITQFPFKAVDSENHSE